MTEINNLLNLQIQETSITEVGLKKLRVIKYMEMITIQVCNNNFTFDGLLKISCELPHCEILAKGDGSFCNGEFEGKWKH